MIRAFLFFNLLCCSVNAYFSALNWHSDTCPFEDTPNVNNFVLPANLMCPDNEPSCYDPPEKLEIGIALLNGPFKAIKIYSKFTGNKELTALMGGFNAMSDISLLWLQGNASVKEFSIFSVRILREILRTQTSPETQGFGSFDDLFESIQFYNPATLSKAALKVPLIIEKNLDWGSSSMTTYIWLASSLPGIVLALGEHYSRFYKLHTIRPLCGFGLTALELASFGSMCTEEQSFYKNSRQLLRTVLHAVQYYALFVDRDSSGKGKFKRFTMFTILEHFGIALADVLYYKLRFGIAL
ncbi:MAG: hypothetical protein WCK42_05225 [Myxococcaceae bacterium]